MEFSAELKLAKDNSITGKFESDRGDFEISEGQFQPEKKKLYFSSESEQFFLDYEAKLEGETMSAT